jgi:hypothetical protein
MRTFAATILLTLALAATASAGGFSTIGVDSLPGAVAPGDRWDPAITLLGHGRTPIPVARPVVILRSGGRSERFVATATDRPGVYRAQVTFPDRGRWSVAIDEGWGYEHHFGSVLVDDSAGAAAPAARDSASPGPLLPLALAALAGLLAAAGTALLLRRRPRALAPAAS